MISGIISWIVFSLLIGIIGSNRKIGFGGAFFLSLLLSPLIGIVFTLVSKSTADEKFEQELLQTQKLQQKAIEKITNQNLNSVADDLKKIKELLENGVINNEDYEKMKTNIINKYNGSATGDFLDVPTNEEIEIADSSLSDLEKDKVRKLMQNLKNDEVITKHQVNKKIEIMTLKDYEEWKKHYGENMLKILVKK